MDISSPPIVAAQRHAQPRRANAPADFTQHLPPAVGCSRMLDAIAHRAFGLHSRDDFVSLEATLGVNGVQRLMEPATSTPFL